MNDCIMRRAAVSTSRILPGLFLLFVLFALVGCSGSPGDKAKAENSPKKRAVPVLVGRAEKKTVPVELRAIGKVEPYATVAIKSQVTGMLQSIQFKEGDEVKQGDTLFTIDTRPFIAMLNQARSSLIRDQAELDNARKELARYARASRKGYVSTEQADQAETRVATLSATIKADEAAVENARLQLEFCTISAPIDGRTGELPVAVGNLIKANADTDMVTINQIQPVKVSFSVPGRYFSEVKKFQGEGSLQVSILAPTGEAQTGLFSFIDNSVDAATGTILLKAEFANQARTLWPGQFVDVRLRLTSRPDSTVVPSQAVQIGQDGAHVFVVKDDSTVEERKIAVGMLVNGDIVIESGLNPGERVVIDGQLQLTNGVKIEDRGKEPGEQAGQPAGQGRKQPRSTP